MNAATLQTPRIRSSDRLIITFSDPFPLGTQPAPPFVRVWVWNRPSETLPNTSATMRTLRNTFLTLSILLASSLLAQQQYFVNISGHHTPCDPSIASGFVYIESLPGTIPEIAVDVPINANCYYTITLEVNSDEFGFQIFSGCTNTITAIVGDSAMGLPPGTTIAIVQDFDCSAQTVDCLGTANGTALPGTPCLTPMNGQGTWNANCQCIPNAVPCMACITITQSSSAGALTPFSADLSSCSTGGTAPYTYLWDFSNGASQTGASVTQTYPGPGTYMVCLNLSTSDGCTSSVCDSVYVDADGFISTSPNNTTDCLGVLNGPNVPGTPCQDPMTGTGIWNANCECITDPLFCQACITVEQASTGGTSTPFVADFSSCSTGGVAPFTYVWDFSNTGSQTGASVTYTFPGPGTHMVCLNLTSADGCTSSVCDSVFVDADGNITTTPTTTTDCLGISNGPNVPGSACSTPVNGPGTWSNTCECLPNVSLPCEAGFWVMQAYTNGDSTNTGGGTVEPIPFELWIWNQSSGGTGNYQFVWDFGDGNSSTEAFPTHVYAASGPYTICLTITDDAGCTSTYCEDVEVDQDGILGMGTGLDVRSVLTIRVIQQLPTGINEVEALEATKLWPNPVVEQFNLTLNSSRSGNLILTIVDLNGREVRTSNASVVAGNNQLPMDVSGLEPGMYVLRLSNGTNSAALRFVKH
jgi:PKD repeat protein